MVDLPGMTMVACRDRGQPADIKEKINELLSSYIKEPKTIPIPAPAPARAIVAHPAPINFAPSAIKKKHSLMLSLNL